VIGESDGKNFYGRAICIKEDGSRYDGFWPIDESRQSYGRLIKPNGYIYEGNYFESMCHGQGKYTTLDGESYQGGFLCNQKGGYGHLTLPSTEVYRGLFKNNMRNGSGKCTFPN